VTTSEACLVSTCERKNRRPLATNRTSELNMIVFNKS